MRVSRRQRTAIGPGTTDNPDLADPPVPFAIADRATTGGTVISLIGELDIVTADQAEHVIMRLIDQHGAPVLIDLTCLAFCDVRGLGVLVRLRRHAAQGGQPLRIAGPNEQVQRIIAVAGLAGELPCLSIMQSPGGQEPAEPGRPPRARNRRG